jgi:hypothetical protein
MLRFTVAVVCLLGLLPRLSLAQTAATTQFVYCSVDDQGGRDLWVSQIFQTSMVVGTWMAESQRMATEFHRHVATLGGSGLKNCVVTDSQAAAEAVRAKIAAIAGRRSLGIRLKKWHDVQWTPSPAPADALVAANSPVSRFVYCRVDDETVNKLVTTNVFNATMPPAASAAYFEELNRINREFSAHLAAAHGSQESGLCIASDTPAEAQKSLADYKKLFWVQSYLKKIEDPWRPTPAAAATSMAATSTPGTTAINATAGVPAAATQPAKPIAPDTGNIESDYWNRIVNSSYADDFDDYLEAFPEGKHAPLARLEAKRLRRSAATPAGGGEVVAPQISSKVADAATAPSLPVDETVRQQIANEAFFKIPASDGAPIQRSGNRNVGAIPLATTVKLMREQDSNLCRLDMDVSAGKEVAIHNVGSGLTWAGLIQLTMNTQTTASGHVSNSTFRVTRIDKLVGQPFPLTAGKQFAASMTADNVDSNGVTMGYTFRLSCEVGKTGPASAIVPGMVGDQTEMNCSLTFDAKGTRPQQTVQHWFSAAGCFAQDPSRP